MQFHQIESADGVLERRFTLGDVPGVLWTADPPSDPVPLVLTGHPGGMHMLEPPVAGRARGLVRDFGLAVAGIDAPGHGARPRSDADAAAVEGLRQARADGRPLGPIVSAFNGSLAERAVPEWRAVLAALRDLPEIDAAAPVGYSGMTLATEIGIRLAAEEPLIGAAVFGGGFASDQLVAAARRIEAPVQYLLAWDDPEIGREQGLALYDAFGSAQKTLHANSGTHRQVPQFEAADSGRFLARHLLR